MRVACLVNRTHAASAKRLHHDKMIEGPLYQIFLSAIATNHARQRFVTTGIEYRAANPAGLGHRGKAPSIDMEIDCNIGEVANKRMAEAS